MQWIVGIVILSYTFVYIKYIYILFSNVICLHPAFYILCANFKVHFTMKLYVCYIYLK